jgi:hypothetical protein
MICIGVNRADLLSLLNSMLDLVTDDYSIDLNLSFNYFVSHDVAIYSLSCEFFTSSDVISSDTINVLVSGCLEDNIVIGLVGVSISEFISFLQNTPEVIVMHLDVLKVGDVYSCSILSLDRFSGELCE